MEYYRLLAHEIAACKRMEVDYEINGKTVTFAAG